MSKTALIAGCCGLIGSHLSEYLLANGYQVYGLDNLSTGTKHNLTRLKSSQNFSFISGNVEDSWHEKTKDIKKIDLVFHLASPACPEYFYKQGLKTLTSNSFGLWNMLELADHFKARLVFASTSEVYGDPLESPQKESYWGHVNSFGPRSSYDESKRFGETLIYNWNKEKHTKHGLVRIFNTYGPRMSTDDQRVIHRFFNQAAQNETLEIHGDGSQTRSFCYVDDLVDGIFRYAQSSHTEPVNLGSDQEITVLELAKKILRLYDQPEKKIKFIQKRVDDPIQRKPDLQRAKEWLNWSPQITIDQGLLRMKNDQSHQESSLAPHSHSLKAL